MRKSATWCAIVAAGILSLADRAQAESPKGYQVTGPVLEMSDSMIVVQKGEDRWELARDSKTRMNGDVKVGSKVTIKYTMTATEVTAKADKAEKK